MASSIGDATLDVRPDVVLALHACDTATDDALARAIAWETPLVLAAPCCHHDIAAQLRKEPTPAPYAVLTRHGILRERFADTLTDGLRASLLRLEGYRVDVMQFVGSQHTPRNTLLRGVRTGSAGERRLRAARVRRAGRGLGRAAAARRACSSGRDGVADAAPPGGPRHRGAGDARPRRDAGSTCRVTRCSPSRTRGSPRRARSSSTTGCSSRRTTPGIPARSSSSTRRGRTVGVTHWSDDPVDTEALAPGGPGHVWVADIGDNAAGRSSVAIARVPVGRGERTVHPTTYELTYPDGATDAETLLRDPTSGRLYIASKNVFGGVLYAVPEHLDASGPNRMRSIGRVLPVATDGAFFPDGEHVVIRNYTTAVVYDWPSLQPVGSFRLPSQRQGEGIGVAADGKVYVSSEGPRAPVLEVTLPPKIDGRRERSGRRARRRRPRRAPRTPRPTSRDRPGVARHLALARGGTVRRPSPSSSWSGPSGRTDPPSHLRVAHVRNARGIRRCHGAAATELTGRARLDAGAAPVAASSTSTRTAHGWRARTSTRVKGLVIPPAWEDVWICRWPNGHLQAVGTDDAGRRQYLYHPDWRVAARRGQARAGRGVRPRRCRSARERVLTDLGTRPGMSRDRACAVAVRLLDLGLLPDRQRRVRRGARQLRPHHAATPARAQAGRRDESSASSASRGSSTRSPSTTPRPSRRSR